MSTRTYVECDAPTCTTRIAGDTLDGDIPSGWFRMSRPPTMNARSLEVDLCSADCVVAYSQHREALRPGQVQV